MPAGTSIDWYVTLQMTSPGPATLVPPGWYVLPDHHQHHRHTLLAGLPVNNLDSWDINKLGWLKIDNSGRLATPSLQQLQQQFLPTVDSCAGGRYSGVFARGFIDKQDIGGTSVTEEFPFVSNIHVWQRHVEMEHKESPLLALTLQHRNKVGVVVHYSNSQLTDFTGLLYQDSFSNLHLNLSLVQAAGTILGEILGNNTTQSIQLHLTATPSNITRQVKLIVTNCISGSLSINLRPQSTLSQGITKSLSCRSDHMQRFQSSPGMAIPVGTSSGLDCVGCESSWLYWLDPGHWLETAWPQTRVVIITIMVLMGVLAIFILCKLIACFGKCNTQSRCKIVTHDIHGRRHETVF